MPICLCLFSGIPASGKTTTARKIISLMRDISVTHLNYDEFVQTGICYRDFRKMMLQKIEEFVKKHKSQETVLLIVDDNMILRSMRKEVHNIAKVQRLGYFQIWFKTSLAKAQERNRLRENPLPETTVSNLFNGMEDPSRDTNVDTIIIAVDDGQQIDINRFREKVLQHLENREIPPEPPRQKEKVSQSDLHKIDLILRHEISRRVQEAPDAINMRTLSEALNNRRKNLLKIFRESSQIPESIDEVRSLLGNSCTNSSVE
uniref:Putative nucleotide kinase n=1 Tax=Nyssomyia neivai TaxID=330878 RepID=A0A1L8DCF1_9DIPT